MALVLFGTEACHLCEDAQALIVSVQPSLAVNVYLEDIAHSAQQVEDYGMRIPVLQHEASGDELDWPFDRTQLLQWLAAHHCLNTPSDHNNKQ